MREIYLDNAATARPWPEVIETVTEVMRDGFGNASSLHRRGLDAARRVADARQAVLDLVGSGEWRVVFTSGGSESDTTAVLGSAPRGKRDGIITTTVAHAAVEDSCKRAVELGARLVEVSAGETGVVEPEAIAAATDEQTALIALNHVASEMGTVQPVAESARQVKRVASRSRVLVDAVQAVAQLPALDYPREVDMVVLSAHKLHGPPGVGALLLRPDVKPRKLIRGGDQQDGLRSGSIDVAGVAGFGTAARLLRERRSEGVARMRDIADRLIADVGAAVDGVRTLGDPARRAPGLVLLAIGGVRSEVLLHALEMRGVLAASSSACHSARVDPPRCLVDAGLRRDEGAVRLSLSFDTTGDEADQAARILAEAVRDLRSGRAAVAR
ncbi:MAG: aminotransferase class V-fold PLP-dependent enzyme [Deltaproteobacteria bacterium]|nr:aminotransferase class V-fold PLP-dependent enzyme [Deltaproteobacteria bacterium]